jgi:hypothetical protein
MPESGGVNCSCCFCCTHELASLGVRAAAATEEEPGAGDAGRRPASIFLVMGSDSKSSESLLLLLLMLMQLRLTALLAFCSYPACCGVLPEPLLGDNSWKASRVKLETGMSSIGEQGPSDTARREFVREEVVKVGDAIQSGWRRGLKWEAKCW